MCRHCEANDAAESRRPRVHAALAAIAAALLASPNADAAGVGQMLADGITTAERRHAGESDYLTPDGPLRSGDAETRGVRVGVLWELGEFAAHGRDECATIRLELGDPDARGTRLVTFDEPRADGVIAVGEIVYGGGAPGALDVVTTVEIRADMVAGDPTDPDALESAADRAVRESQRLHGR